MMQRANRFNRMQGRKQGSAEARERIIRWLRGMADRDPDYPVPGRLTKASKRTMQLLAASLEAGEDTEKFA